MFDAKNVKLNELSYKAAELLMSKYYELCRDLSGNKISNELKRARTTDIARFISKTFLEEEDDI